jgi:hypothetical protein
MRVFVYVSESKGVTALTVDESGANLPPQLGPWRREANAVMPVGGPGPDGWPDMLQQTLDRQGYYLAHAVPVQELPPSAELSDSAYDRADKLAREVIDHLTREPHGVLVTVGALQLATVRILATLDHSGAVLEAYIEDLRRIFSETQAALPEASAPPRH